MAKIGEGSFAAWLRTGVREIRPASIPKATFGAH